MAGTRLPVVVVNIMRGGPGLGSIGAIPGRLPPGDQGARPRRLPGARACTLVHRRGDRPGRATRSIIAERYRTPVMILADGILGQAMEPVEPDFRSRSSTGSRTGPSPGPRIASPASLRSPQPARRGSRAPQRSICRRSTARSRHARSAGRASSSTTPRSSSSPTAPLPGSRGPRWSVRGPKGCGPGSSARSPCGRSRRPRCALPRQTQAACSSSRCRPARWSRTCGSRSTARSRSSSTGGPVAWCPTPDDVVACRPPRLGPNRLDTRMPPRARAGQRRPGDERAR